MFSGCVVWEGGMGDVALACKRYAGDRWGNFRGRYICGGGCLCGQYVLYMEVRRGFVVS